MNEVHRKIIEAAEIEFAEKGYGGASIREITKRAGVNVAAINYHFGGKEALFKEMVRYRIEPINRVRLQLLEDARRANAPHPVPLEQIVEIIVRPLLSKLINESCEDFRFMRAIGKSMAEERPFMRDLQKEILKEILENFIGALSESLGRPGAKKIGYGMHFLSCAMTGAMMQHNRLKLISQGEIDLKDFEGLVTHLVAFITAGLKAVANLKEDAPNG